MDAYILILFHLKAAHATHFSQKLLIRAFEMHCQVLFKKANLLVERGEKIAIIGPNGCGKSTLLKLAMGLEKPRAGEVLLGEHNVLPNYFEQNQVS